MTIDPRSRIGIIAFVLVLLAVVAYFVYQNGKKDTIIIGGPCTYDSMALVSKVLEIRKLGEEHADLVLVIERPDEGPDTLTYHGLVYQYPTVKELKEKGIKVGSLLKFTYLTIRTGTCSPHGYGPSLDTISAKSGQ